MKPTSTTIALHALCLLLLLGATSTMACYCIEPTVEEDFQDSELVFSRKVTQNELIEDERRAQATSTIRFTPYIYYSSLYIGRLLPALERDWSIGFRWR